jgi:hypothetical protein
MVKKKLSISRILRLAGRTRQRRPGDGIGKRRHQELKIGCGFIIVPMWHPLRLAGGQVIFGVGRG